LKIKTSSAIHDQTDTETSGRRSLGDRRSLRDRRSVRERVVTMTRLVSIVCRRMNKGLRWTWVSLLWAVVPTSTVIGALFYDANGINKLMAVYVLLITQYAFTGAPRIIALYAQMRLLLYEYRDGVINLHYFTIGAVGLLTAQAVFGTFMCGQPLPFPFCLPLSPSNSSEVPFHWCSQRLALLTALQRSCAHNHSSLSCMMPGCGVLLVSHSTSHSVVTFVH